MDAHSLLMCCVDNSNPFISPSDLRAQKRRNKEIEKELSRDRQRLLNRRMILLLGTGESGKSTFLKQMRIIHGKQFSSKELDQLKDTIFDNIYKGILFLLQARENLDLPWSSAAKSLAAASKLEEHFRLTRNAHRERAKRSQLMWTEDEFLALVPALNVVWSDGSIQEAFNQRHKVITENFSENTRYYLNKLDAIGVKNYIPTEEDIVWSRKPTDSIIEEHINIHGSSLTFVDVGGQTKERRKWFQCFTDMTSVLFLIASSHFDEFYQDRVTEELRNKLGEAKIVFDSLINHAVFRRISVIMFFNKTDILEEKLRAKVSNIKASFPDFPVESDPFDLADVQTFLVNKFTESIYAADLPQRPVYRHFTTAVDRRNIETVFNAMQDTVLRSNVRQIMLS